MARDVFGPKLVQHSLYIIRVKAAPARRSISELAQAHYSRKGIAGIWRERCICRFMDNTIGRDVKLIASD
jgi:hypothetical protein